jgi:L-Ala-D/L-Glu epimerase
MKRSNVPLIYRSWQEAYDGINIKLMKSGGIQEALRMIHVARALGMKVMLGCMIESSLAISAAAHLEPAGGLR